MKESHYKIKKLNILSGSHKLEYRVLLAIGAVLVTSFFIWWFNPIHIASNFNGPYRILDILLFITLSYVVWNQIINECFSWYVASFMKEPKPITPPESNLRVAFLTAFVPGKEPYDVLEKTLSAMVKTDYPHDTWLLDEGDDFQAKQLCDQYGVNHFSRKGILKYNTSEGAFKTKTKAGNYNSWFHSHGSKYDIVAQLDVDFVPSKNFLTKTLGYFKDPEVAFVGTPQIYGNISESWIVKGAAEQAYNFYGPIQKGLFGMDMPLFIGANHVLRVAAHDDIEGYSGHIVEDHLTGMRLYAKKWKSVYVPEILAVGEGPSTWDSYFSQQMRWAFGLIDILFNHTPKIGIKMKRLHFFNYFLLQQFYFYGLAQVLGLVLLCLYFFFGINSTSMELLPLLELYVPLIIFQQVMFLWLQKFNVSPETEKGLMIRGKILSMAAWPIYFLAFIGVIAKKRLAYVVTPKGANQRDNSNVKLFVPHLLLGIISLFCVLMALFTANNAPQLVFWALLNTLVMFSFVLLELGKSFAFVKNLVWEVSALLLAQVPNVLLILLFSVVSTIIVEQKTSAKFLSAVSNQEVVTAVSDTKVASTSPIKYLEIDDSVIEKDNISNVTTYKVVDGDNLWSIARKYLGDGRNWVLIKTPNNSTVIYPNDILGIPESPDITQL